MLKQAKNMIAVYDANQPNVDKNAIVRIKVLEVKIKKSEKRCLLDFSCGV